LDGALVDVGSLKPPTPRAKLHNFDMIIIIFHPSHFAYGFQDRVE